MSEREKKLADLVKHLMEELFSAWHEGASDCHTTGEIDRYPETDAFKEEEMARALLAEIMSNE